MEVSWRWKRPDAHACADQLRAVRGLAGGARHVEERAELVPGTVDGTRRCHVVRRRRESQARREPGALRLPAGSLLPRPPRGLLARGETATGDTAMVPSREERE